MANERIKIRVLKPLLGVAAPGDIVEVEARKGQPADRFWRRRLADATTDGCCEIIEEKTTTKRAASKSPDSEE